MKTLLNIVNEKLILNKSTKQDYGHTYHYHPKTWNELRDLLEKLLKERGEDADLNDIDTSAITYMAELFYQLDPHNIDISDWDVSNVENMHNMFYGCKYFNCDISDWDVSKVISMWQMFHGCEYFNCDLSNWDVSSVINVKYMFGGCYRLKHVPEWFRILNEKPVSEKLILNKSTNVKQEYHYQPKLKHELKNLLRQLLQDRGPDANLNDIDTSKMTDMGYVFYDLDPHNIDISGWDVSNVVDMDSMFYNCINFNSDLSSWDVSEVTNMYRMFFNCRNFDCDLSMWNMENVLDADWMLHGCRKFQLNNEPKALRP